MGPKWGPIWGRQENMNWLYMMTSSNGNIFRVTGHLCGEFTSPRWIPRTHKGQWCGALMFSLICVWINGWVNNREAADLRLYRAHYDVIVICIALTKLYTFVYKIRGTLRRLSGKRWHLQCLEIIIVHHSDFHISLMCLYCVPGV